MTTPIARLTVTRLKDSPLPLKLSYVANVFRFRQNQPGRQCEFHQAGVELLVVSNAFADAEIATLAAQALNVAGLDDFTSAWDRLTLRRSGDFVGGNSTGKQLRVNELIRLKVSSPVTSGGNFFAQKKRWTTSDA